MPVQEVEKAHLMTELDRAVVANPYKKKEF